MIDLTVPGSPASCRATADTLATLASTADTTIDTLTAAMGSVDGAWTGMAADAAAVRLAAARDSASTLESRASSARDALRTFADELTVVIDRMSGIRDDAAHGGLVTGTTSVSAPHEPGADPTPEETARYDRLLALYRDLRDRAFEARDLERAAHDRLARAVGDITADNALISFLKDAGLLPPDWTAAGLGGFAAGSVLTGLGWRASWLTRVSLGRFAPRVNGAFAPIGNGWFGNRWFGPNTWRALNDANWTARPYQAGSYARWSTAGKWVGRAGVVVSFGVSAYDQWQADADDPTLSTGERVARAGTVGATTAAGGWAGAWAGAQVGGMIGTAVGGPVGTVVGGAIGGIVGGVIGSGVGQAAGQWVVDQADEWGAAIGDAWDAAGDALADAGDAIGGALSDAGDALSDFGDALTFWD